MVANVRCSLERVSCGTACGKFVSFHFRLSNFGAYFIYIQVNGLWIPLMREPLSC